MEQLLINPHLWLGLGAFAAGAFLVWLNMRPATPLYQQGFAHGVAMCDHPADRAECYSDLEHAEGHGTYGAWERGVADALAKYPYGLPRPGGLCPSCVEALGGEDYHVNKGFTTDPAVQEYVDKSIPLMVDALTPILGSRMAHAAMGALPIGPTPKESVEVMLVNPAKVNDTLMTGDFCAEAPTAGYHTVKVARSAEGRWYALEDSVFHPYPVSRRVHTCERCKDTGKVTERHQTNIGPMDITEACPDCYPTAFE